MSFYLMKLYSISPKVKRKGFRIYSEMFYSPWTSADISFDNILLLLPYVTKNKIFGRILNNDNVIDMGN